MALPTCPPPSSRHVLLIAMAETQEKQNYIKPRLRTDSLSLLLCSLLSNTVSQEREHRSTHEGKENYKFTAKDMDTERVEEIGPMLQFNTVEGKK